MVIFHSYVNVYQRVGILLAIIPINGLRPPIFPGTIPRPPKTFPEKTAKASSSLSSFFFFFLSSPGTISPGPVVNPFWAFHVRFQRGTMVPPSFGLSQDALVPTRKERYLMILMPWKTSQQNGGQVCCWMIRSIEYWLVGGVPTILKNISQLGWLFPIYGKIKNVPNHQPVRHLSHLAGYRSSVASARVLVLDPFWVIKKATGPQVYSKAIHDQIPKATGAAVLINMPRVNTSMTHPSKTWKL